MDRTETSRRRLEAAFWNALGRRQSEKSARAAGLAQKMEQATARRLNDSLSGIPSILFRLTPQQWRTLQEAGMTAGQAALLGELDHRVKAVDEYQRQRFTGRDRINPGKRGRLERVVDREHPAGAPAASKTAGGAADRRCGKAGRGGKPYGSGGQGKHPRAGGSRNNSRTAGKAFGSPEKGS